MGQKGLMTRAAIQGIAFLVALFLPVMLLAEPVLSGANYFGDSDNAVIYRHDVIALA